MSELPAIRQIGFQEWPRLAAILKESRSDEPLPEPRQSIVLMAEEMNSTVGCIGAEKVWCVSPLWVERQRRGSGLALSLADELALFNTERLREMCVTTNPHVERLIYGLGFKPIRGQLWRRHRDEQE